MIIFLNNAEREIVQSALYDYFINLNSTILYKYLKGGILAIEVKPIRLHPEYAEFNLDKFKQDFKHIILHIDHKNNLV